MGKRVCRVVKRWVALALLLAVLGAAFSGCMPPIFDVDIALEPTLSDAEGIAPNTQFTLRDKAGPTLEQLREEIRFEPETTFSLTPGEREGEFLLEAYTIFEAGSEVTVFVRNKSFPFTVQQALVVAQNFPAAKSGNVPLGTGVEFMFNSNQVMQADFENAFTITPEVEGSFTRAEDRYIFYPTDSFAPNTQYIITLQNGLGSADGLTLKEPFSLTFKTGEGDGATWPDTPLFEFGGNGVSFNALSDEAPLLPLYINAEGVSSAGLDGAAQTTLYKLPNVEAYSAQLEKQLPNAQIIQPTFELSGSEQVATFSATPMRGNADDGWYGNTYLLQFPEALPEGWYVAELTLQLAGQTATRQILLQVSDLAVFYMWSGENMLAWVNDAATGGPVEGALITLEGGIKAQATTSAEGIATVRNVAASPQLNNYTRRNLITAQVGGRTFVDINSLYYSGYYEENASSQSYFSYLYCDRPIYHSTDTIRLWGLVRPRDPAVTQAPQTVALRLDDGLAETQAKVLPDGTFTAELPIENIAPNPWSRLSLEVDAATLTAETVEIADFVKPVYTASASTRQPVVLLQGNTEVPVDLNVSLFDGTPAASMLMGLDAYGGAAGTEVPHPLATTDDNGDATATMHLADSYNSWRPVPVYYAYNSRGAEAEHLYVRGTLYTVHRDVMLRGKRLQNDAAGYDVEVSTHGVDISSIQDAEQIWDEDNLQGPALAREVRAELHKTTYQKQKSGTYYDYVNRRTVDSYRHVRHDEVVDTYHFTTQDGTHTMEGLPTSDETTCYYLEILCEDSLGRTVEETVYLGPVYPVYTGATSGQTQYQLTKRPAASDVPNGEVNLDVYWVPTAFADGEEVVYDLSENGVAMQQGEGRTLHCLVQDGFSHVGVTEEPFFTVPFSEQLLPNYVATGAYFDGRHVFALENTHAGFDPGARELNIQVQPDRETYAPADEVSLGIHVTNRQTGAVEAGTSLLLSVVDEAVFAITEQDADILQSVYNMVYWPEIYKYTSFYQPSTHSGGEKGGGGGPQSLRKDFEDTAHFAALKTDANGNASLTFTLPDNITSWRATALGVTEGLHLGSATANLRATKPFYVMPIVNKQLVQADSFAVGLYGAGGSVAAGDEVAYTVRVQGNSVDATMQVSSALRRYTSVDFGALKAGAYTVTVKGACNGHTDTVQLPFEVNTGNVHVRGVKTFNLAEGLSLDPLQYPVNLLLYGQGAKTYNHILRSVQWNSAGGRADMRLARRYMAGLLSETGEGWYEEEAANENISDLSGTQMLSLLPYGDTDIELTVRAHMAAPQLVGTAALRKAALGEEYSPYSSAFLYLAQALSGIAISTDLNALLEKETAFDYVEQLAIVTAMAVAGDEESAQKWYEKLVLPHLQKATGVSGMSILSVGAQGENRSLRACTAAASLLATTLKTAEAEGLVLFLAEKDAQYEAYVLEQMYYLTNCAPQGDGADSFSYMQDGKRVRVELENGMHHLTLNAAQLASANFKVEGGSVFADAYYTAAPGEFDNAGTQHLGLRKTVEAVEGNFEVGALVKITLTPDFSRVDTSVGATTLLIDEYIPTGLRFEQFTYDHAAKGWYLAGRQGQRLQFTLSGVGWLLTPIVYYARVSTPGEYLVESAYIASNQGESWGISEPQTIQLG